MLEFAALLRFEGQLSVFKPWTGGPCYRCLFSEKPPSGLVPRCEEAGILGAVAGVDIRRPAIKLPALGRFGMAAWP